MVSCAFRNARLGLGSARVSRAVVSVADTTAFPDLTRLRLAARVWTGEVSGGTPETTRQRRVLPFWDGARRFGCGWAVTVGMNGRLAVAGGRLVSGGGEIGFPGRCFAVLIRA